MFDLDLNSITLDRHNPDYDGAPPPESQETGLDSLFGCVLIAGLNIWLTIVGWTLRIQYA